MAIGAGSRPATVAKKPEEAPQPVPQQAPTHNGGASGAFAGPDINAQALANIQAHQAAQLAWSQQQQQQQELERAQYMQEQARQQRMQQMAMELSPTQHFRNAFAEQQAQWARQAPAQATPTMSRPGLRQSRGGMPRFAGAQPSLAMRHAPNSQWEEDALHPQMSMNPLAFGA